MTLARHVETSPQRYARTGGALYLIIIVASFFAEFYVRDKLWMADNVAATAKNIMSHQLQWRLSISAELIMIACDAVLSLIFYVLFKPVNRNLALLAALFRIVSVAIAGVIKLCLFAVLLLLSGGDNLNAFEPAQLQGLAYLSLEIHGIGYNISLVFFGFHYFILAILILKSGYLPKLLGTFVIIGSICILTNCFAWFLTPTVAQKLFPVILIPAGLADISLFLWLTIKGVNLLKWNQKVRLQQVEEGYVNT